MIKKKSFSVLAAGVMVFSVLFTGCQSDADKATEGVEETGTEEAAKEEVKEEAKEGEVKEEQKAVELSDWDGTWNNMGVYLEEADIQGAYEELGKKEDMTTEEAKEAYLKKRKSDFDGLVIEGNKVKFLDGFEDKDGKEIAAMEYEYKETKVVPRGDSELEWDVFESKEDGEYKVLIMMDVDTEEALTHFHMRYGKDLDSILAQEDWFPTFVKPDSTMEQLYDEIAE